MVDCEGSSSYTQVQLDADRSMCYSAYHSDGDRADFKIHREGHPERVMK